MALYKGNVLIAGGNLPDQTGQSGKYLTTDGQYPSWTSISVSDSYKKSETSSSTELSNEFRKYETISDLTANYYRKTETSSSAQLVSEFQKYQLSGNYLLSSNLSFTYDSQAKYIYLKAFNGEIGSVNCADFIKDGMLSTVELCGNTLIFKFNTDAGTTPISVNLSSFVDNYDGKILYLSNAISTDVKNLADNYYKKTDTTLNSNGQIKIGNTTITALTAHQSLTAYETKADLTANYYKKSETSSATQIQNADNTLRSQISSKVSLGKYDGSAYDMRNADLSVVAIDQEEFYKMVAASADLSDVLYVLSGDGLNANGQKIVKVAEPTLSDDAATKNYVDSHSAGGTWGSITGDLAAQTDLKNALDAKANTSQIPTVNNGTLTIQRNGTTLTSFSANQAGNATANIQACTSITMNGGSKSMSNGIIDIGTVLTAHQSLTAYETIADLTSNYYKKSDTTLNSNGQLKIGSTTITALTAHQSLANYCTGTQVSAIVSAMVSAMIDTALTAQYGDVLNEEF